MTLTFLGAARTVTGSKHLLEVDGHRVLIDCGLFQGAKVLRERNWQSLPVRADSIHAIVLTHAHLDHCGYLPRLVSQGFKGRIFCTPATSELSKIVLADAATDARIPVTSPVRSVEINQDHAAFAQFDRSR